MKSKLKWISGVLGAVLALSLVFGAGVYANEQGWLTFDSEQVADSHDDLEEIMRILREVNEGKINAEEALADLKELNPSGLAKKNQELRDEIKNLNELLDLSYTDVSGLHDTINSQKQQIAEHEDIVATKDQTISQLQQDKDSAIADMNNFQQLMEQEMLNNDSLKIENAQLSTDNASKDKSIEQLTKERDNLQEQLNGIPEDQTDYISHLEKELESANEAVANHARNTNAAVEEARTYQE